MVLLSLKYCMLRTTQHSTIHANAITGGLQQTEPTVRTKTFIFTAYFCYYVWSFLPWSPEIDVSEKKSGDYVTTLYVNYFQDFCDRMVPRACYDVGWRSRAIMWECYLDPVVTGVYVLR